MVCSRLYHKSLCVFVYAEAFYSLVHHFSLSTATLMKNWTVCKDCLQIWSLKHAFAVWKLSIRSFSVPRCYPKPCRLGIACVQRLLMLSRFANHLHACMHMHSGILGGRHTSLDTSCDMSKVTGEQARLRNGLQLSPVILRLHHGCVLYIEFLLYYYDKTTKWGRVGDALILLERSITSFIIAIRPCKLASFTPPPCQQGCFIASFVIT